MDEFEKFELQIYDRSKKNLINISNRKPWYMVCQGHTYFIYKKTTKLYKKKLIIQNWISPPSTAFIFQNLSALKYFSISSYYYWIWCFIYYTYLKIYSCLYGAGVMSTVLSHSGLNLWNLFSAYISSLIPNDKIHILNRKCDIVMLYLISIIL